jgi:hypothetical protein
MNLRTQIAALLAATFLPLSPDVLAQANPALAAPPIESSNPQGGRNPSDPEQKKLPALRIAQGPMSDAVKQLLKEMKAAQIPELNVIYNPGAEGVVVPELTLRNIRGADALQLIAASVGCQVEAIPGQDAEIIGYRIMGAPAGGGYVPGLEPTPGSGGVGFFGIPGGGAPPAPGIGYPGAAVNPSVAAPPLADPAMRNIPGGDVVMSFGSTPAENVSSARVYPLGSITTVTKFNDVEETLREVLQAGGIGSSDVKLALHEKTNVLIVTGTTRVHEAVKQLLDALEKNTAASEVANRRGDESRRDIIQMQVRLEAEREERARLMKQMEQLESQRAEIVQELERARAAKPR